VQITADKVEIINSGSEMLFYRPPNSLPMAMPKEGMEAKALNKYLNVSKPQQMLLTAWITYTMAHPKVPASNYVILALLGGQGTGKSTLNKNLMSIIDPCKVGVQTLPTKPKDLAISLRNSHLRCFDNVRTIGVGLSDTLCTAATGGSIADRKLYTNDEEQVISLHGAFSLNSIHSVIEQSDLAQRCLQLELKRISEDQRKTE
jgi:ABC-type glutathione transport system ATPase component